MNKNIVLFLFLILVSSHLSGQPDAKLFRTIAKLDSTFFVAFNNCDLDTYDIIFLLPQLGTNLIATLVTCDLSPLYTFETTEEDWSIINNNVLSIELEYDRTSKSFHQAFAKK